MNAEVGREPNKPVVSSMQIHTRIDLGENNGKWGSLAVFTSSEFSMLSIPTKEKTELVRNVLSHYYVQFLF